MNRFEQKSAGSSDTPLLIAMERCRPAVVRELLLAGADPNLRRGGHFDTDTPLLEAAVSGQPECVALLLQHRAQVNARIGGRGAGPAALLSAIRGGHRQIVSLLLAAGATVERRDLFAAISQGDVEITRLLLDAGADPSWTLGAGRTAVDEAEGSPLPARQEILRLLRGMLPREAIR